MSNDFRGNRPLSPHLTIYRPQLSSITSIFVRITGIALSAAFIIIVWWILAAATSESYFNYVSTFMQSWIGLLFFCGALWALWYHFLGGIRHLIWDMGYGLDMKTADIMGISMIIASFILTGGTIWMIVECIK